MPRRRPGVVRTAVGVVLLVVAGLSAALGVAVHWLHDEVLDPDHWSATSAALIADPVVRDDVSRVLAERIVEASGLEQRLGAALPGPLGALSGLAAGQATALVAKATSAAAGTQAFAGVWQSANRSAWAEVLGALRDQGRVTSVQDGALVLDLGPALDLVRDELSDLGVPAVDRLDLSGVDATLTLVPAPELERLRTLVRVVDVGVVALPILAGVGTVLGLLVFGRLGWGLVVLGAACAVGALGGGALAEWGRSVAVAALQGGVLGQEAARRVVETVTASARSPLATAAIVGGAVAAVGVLVVLVGAGRRRLRPTGV